ncbi:MAG TPA: protein kinase, partial [Planctomycetota bacterium]|nr:protein kinase [Planctomycetota bacterium]
KDPFAIGDDERDARARRTPVPRGPTDLPDPFARRVVTSAENTPAPATIVRPIRRPALSDTPVARKPFTQVMPAAPVAAPVRAADTSDQATVAMPGFTDLTGREMTMPATPAEGMTPVPTSPMLLGAEPTLLTGREMTMPATPAEGSTPAPASPILGAEPTLLTGREMTMPATPAEGTTPAPREGTDGDSARAALHTPRTIPGLAGMVPRARPTAGKPATGVRSSDTVTSDDAWHYQGRVGPFTGQEWGDWDIGGILGEGGMGAVYRAKQKSLNHRVALKVLAPNLAADLRLLQRFQLEARTASLLTSPNVVQVFAAGEFEGNHFFVMEYVEGRDLYDVMKERTSDGKPFTPDEAAGIVIQAAKGLVEAARIGVVHRDIKPPNLMVTNDGLVKIADFGIVKVMGEAVFTMIGQAVGTPSYVSPEQGRGEANIDHRSDLYSLGVVFYELLTGKKPFEGSTPNAIIYQHCYGEPKLPRELNPLIDEKYQAVVLKCLQKKAENRYQNAGELIRDLEDIRSGRMLASALANYRQGTGADEAKRESLSWTQRHLLVLVASLGLVVLAAGVGLYQVIVYQQDKFVREEALRREAERLEKLLIVLNTPRSLPGDVDKLLSDYAKLPFINPKLLENWQAKVKRVNSLREGLKVLDKGEITLAERRRAKADLLAYQEQVGTEEALVVTWKERLEDLEKRERDMRQRLREVDQQVDLTQATVDSVSPLVRQLAVMSGEEDPLVKRVADRLKDFTSRRDRFITSLSVLDQNGTVITDVTRTRMQAELAELKRMIGTQDERVARWDAMLTSNATRITQLRERLRRLDQFELPPVAVQLELDKDFAALKELVDDNDPEMRSWKAKIAATTAEIESLRKRLARLDQPNLLAVAEVEPLARLLTSLRDLVGEGDEQLLAWQKKHKAAVARHGELRNALTRLERPEPLTLDEQRLLAAARELFSGVGGLSEEQDAVYQRRLNDERLQTLARVERLHALDQASSLSTSLRQDLDIFTQQAGEDHVDVKRWNAKRTRIDALQAHVKSL